MKYAGKHLTTKSTLVRRAGMAAVLGCLAASMAAGVGAATAAPSGQGAPFAGRDGSAQVQQQDADGAQMQGRSFERGAWDGEQGEARLDPSGEPQDGLQDGALPGMSGFDGGGERGPRGSVGQAGDAGAEQSGGAVLEQPGQMGDSQASADGSLPPAQLGGDGLDQSDQSGRPGRFSGEQGAQPTGEQQDGAFPRLDGGRGMDVDAVAGDSQPLALPEGQQPTDASRQPAIPENAQAGAQTATDAGQTSALPEGAGRGGIGIQAPGERGGRRGFMDGLGDLMQQLRDALGIETTDPGSAGSSVGTDSSGDKSQPPTLPDGVEAPADGDQPPTLPDEAEAPTDRASRGGIGIGFRESGGDRGMAADLADLIQKAIDALDSGARGEVRSDAQAIAQPAVQPADQPVVMDS